MKNRIFLKAATVIILLALLTSCSKTEKTPDSSTTTTQALPADIAAEMTTDQIGDNEGGGEEELFWALYVIGNDNPLPNDFEVETTSIQGERELDVRCADYAIQMLEDARTDGMGLFVTSSYRSVQKQAENMESYINTLIGNGYSEEEAVKQAHIEIAQPGCSEHNAGLAMDIVTDDWWSNHSDLDETFEEEPEFDWLIENSWKYGFVLSYPEGKEEITGFIYEPWHYRFVGPEDAAAMYEIYQQTGLHITVNEYIENYK